MLSPDHEPVLRAALRAPSAHNAQPWRLLPDPERACYELHYDHTDYLPFDPDDRDAYLCLGAFVETMSLAATRHGQRADFEPSFNRIGPDLFVGRLSLRPAVGEPADPLATAAADRHTNRCEYDVTPLPPPLAEELAELRCVTVAPPAMSRLVARASVCAWRDPRFVRDLRAWFHVDATAPSGMTPAGLPLTRAETGALLLALRLGRLPGALAHVFASRDVRLLKHATTVAVLTADDLTPASLFVWPGCSSLGPSHGFPRLSFPSRAGPGVARSRRRCPLPSSASASQVPRHRLVGVLRARPPRRPDRPLGGRPGLFVWPRARSAGPSPPGFPPSPPSRRPPASAFAAPLPVAVFRVGIPVPRHPLGCVLRRAASARGPPS